MSTVPRLWAVTPPSGTPSVAIVDVWREAGVVDDLALWLRTPGAAPRATFERCAALVERARAVGIPVLIGCAAAAIEEACSIVATAGLHGVVLRADPDRAALDRARARLGPRAWIGRSTHAPAGDHDACDFTVLGPIFAPHTAKPEPVLPLGTDVLARAAANPHARIIAIGGVDQGTAPRCIAAGASGLAGIRSFFGGAAQVIEDVAALRIALPPAKHGPTSP